MAENKKLIVNDLTVSFRTTQGMVRAVRGVSFDLNEGETLAIVGESGSGKSVSSRTIMGILAGNGVINKGEIIYEGEDLTKVDEEHFHEIRGNKIGMIFQDPMSSLNPIMRIGRQITEGMILNGKRMENRYKAIFNDERVTYNRLVREKKQAKRDYKNNVKRSNQGLCDGIIDLKFEVININERLARLDVLIEDNPKFLKLNLEKADKAEHAAIKEESRAKLLEMKNEYAELTAKKKQLIADNKPAIDSYLAGKKAELDAILERLAKEIPVAKAALSAKKKEARAITNAEWNAEKERVNGEIAKVQEKMANASEEAKVELKQEIETLKENLRRFKKVTKLEAYERALQVMEEVGIPEPKKRFRQYPFQFSGGMRQRIVIAIALTASPDVLICDEPTTALDVTIQAQILELINNLKKERNLSVIFITHDLGVVANMADRIAVMYAGKIVELGTAEDVFYDPRHPYTWALLSSMPDLESKERLTAIPGTPPNMLFPPKGDAFADRNKYAMKIDFEVQPPMFKVSDTHSAATWLLHKDAPKVEMPEVIQERIERMLKASEEGAK